RREGPGHDGGKSGCVMPAALSPPHRVNRVRSPERVDHDPSVRDGRRARSRLASSRMQRLFSMFPDGAPGAALAILRLALAWNFRSSHVPISTGNGVGWMQLASGSIAIGLLLGLFTPLLCTACLVVEAASWLLAGMSEPRQHLCIALDAAALG